MTTFGEKDKLKYDDDFKFYTYCFFIDVIWKPI